MQRKRVRILVEMDLDPVPGAYNTPEDCAEQVQANLEWITPHYHPTVTVLEVAEPIPCCGAVKDFESRRIIHKPGCPTWLIVG